MECTVCQKHKNFEAVTGRPLVRLGGLIVSHFPIIEGQPANKGHLLIEAERHVEDVSDLTDSESQALGLLISRSISHLTKVVGAEHAYAFRINDKVPHFHFHIIPRYFNTPNEFWGLKIMDWSGTKLDLQGIKEFSSQPINL
jgi:histidine triad (HIT) family protein